MVGGKEVPSCGILGGCECLPEVRTPRHTTNFQYLKQMLYWNTEVRIQSKVLPSRSQLALLMELLINKKLANKFPVVCLLGGVILHIPATLHGFLGCSAPLDPKECRLLSVTSEVWLPSVPRCKDFSLSALLVYAPCWKLSACWVSPCLPSVLWIPAASYTWICSVALSTFPCFVGLFCSQNTSLGSSAGWLHLSSSFFFRYVIQPHELKSNQSWSFTSSHTPYTPLEQ